MLEPAETSYFSAPSAGLDPRLFKNGKLDSTVRNAILQLLSNYFDSRFVGSNAWSYSWLAGSGVSYQWAANREPGDLDCLVVIDFTRFRQSNTQFAGLSDKEIADDINEDIRANLHPLSAMFMGTFELTFYVITEPSILNIKPYAAYSVTDDRWEVTPSLEGAPVNPTWDKAIERDRTMAIDIATRYLNAKEQYETATNDAVKTNARSQMTVAMSQGVQMYNSIHSERSMAFSTSGQGYNDFYNYRWQANKRSGVIQALRGIVKEMESRQEEFNKKTYGVDLPSTSTLIRRAATSRR